MTRTGITLDTPKGKELGSILMLTMASSSFLGTLSGMSSELSLLQKSTIMLPMSINLAKIKIKKAPTFQSKSKEKDFILYRLIRLLNVALRTSVKTPTTTPEQPSKLVFFRAEVYKN